MKVGPIGCLGLLAAGVVGWAAGRLPAVLAQVPATVSPVDAPAARAPLRASLPAVSAPAPTPIIVTVPAAPPPQVVIVREVRTMVAPGGAAPPELTWRLPTEASPQPAETATPADEPVETGDARVTDTGSGHALASVAYADLARGDRRAAATMFASALAVDPRGPNARVWKRELQRLNKRWSGEAYTQIRDDGTTGLGVSPLLGGGQSGAQLNYTPRPLARRPVYAVLRTTVANSGGFRRPNADTSTSQLAAGIKWQVLPQLSVSGERLFAVGGTGRSAFTVRAAGGYAHRFGPVLADAYAEAGVVGFGSFDPFAGVQGRAALPFELASLRVEPGLGLWGGVQRSGITVSRFDAGPTVAVTWDKWRVRASADYRLKVAGNAQPGSGPAVTVSGWF